MCIRERIIPGVLTMVDDYLGAIFFYAAHLLENERCNQMGLLLNLFISNEKAFFVRFDEEKNELAFRLGEVNA